MGLNLLLGGVAVVSLAAQSSQAEPHSVVVKQQVQASVPIYRLPQMDGAVSSVVPVTSRQAGSFPRIAVPAPRVEQGALPSLDWDKGNAALKMRVVGLHLGWNF